MADNIDNGAAQAAAETTQQTDNGLSPEVNEMMQIALNGGMPQQAIETQQQQEGQTQAVQTPNAEVVITSKPVFEFDTLKEKFGYEKPEDVLREIEELRAFKSQPQTQAELKFENETSEKLFKALQAGKIEEVRKVLVEQDRLESLTTTEVNANTAAEIIKLGMQLRNPNLTQTEIDWKYSKDFGIPKEPVMGSIESDEEFAERKANWEQAVKDTEMNKVFTAKELLPTLVAQKQKLELPKVEQAIDENYASYQQMIADADKINAETIQAYKAFTPKSVETKLSFNDEANKVKFDFQFEPDSESFNEAVEMASDVSKFFNKFRNQDGSPDRQGFLKAIYFGLNHEKAISEALKQAKNATIVAKLPDNSNNGSNLQRQIVTQGEPSEFDKQMQTALRGYV
jgi:hypothetical protein